MNLTGGISWHWLAWRSQARWAPTAQAIEQWLLQSAQALPTKESHEKPTLLLIGASAGWMMSCQWLSQFARVDTFDIDPLAAFLFKLRHGAALKAQGVVLNCHTQDALQNLDALLAAHPKAMVFFDNVLGQIRFQNPRTDQAEKRLGSVTQALHGRHWGSVHDHLSGPVLKAWPEAPLPQAQVCVQGDGRESMFTQQWLGAMGAQSPWLDHLTETVFPGGTALTNMAWPMKPSYWHWLQAGWVRP